MGKKAKVIILGLLSVSSLCVAQTTPLSQMEKLNRGLVVIPGYSGNGCFVSWRFFGTDNDNTSFDVLKDGKVISRNLYDCTNYFDKAGTSLNKYQVVTKQDGVTVDTTEVAVSLGDVCKRIPVDVPANGTIGSEEYYYNISDCSVGDVDADGEYEIMVKFSPSNAQDNSYSGYTGNVYIDCYKMDGTKLWRIDLGKNIRAGAHYNQFLVYDFDGDGKAELICKTAPGSKDAEGFYVSAVATDEVLKSSVDNRKDYRNANGYIDKGPEYLTVFNGLTGKAIHTVYYNPNRQFGLGEVKDGFIDEGWGDSYGNRCDRYLACVAYLDGPDKTPSAVMCRGYYTRAYLWAVNFDGRELKTKWLHSSVSETKVELTDADGNKITKNYTANMRPDNNGSKTVYGNGNHNLSVADVDNDGCDEIIYGSAAIDNDGNLLYATGYGHGDAMHLADHLPDRPGLEVFTVHEAAPYGWDIHDAATGEILLSGTGNGDNGRGVAADIIPGNRGSEFWSANDRRIRSALTGEVLSDVQPWYAFRLYWNGDLYEETFERHILETWNGSAMSRIYPVEGKNFGDYGKMCDGGVHYPNLLADLFGDWREEIVLWNDSELVIMTTNQESDFRVPTLMHDHVYRMGVAWQNSAYNQPPHLGYYLPDSFGTRYVFMSDGTFEQTVNIGDSISEIKCRWKNSGAPTLLKSISPDGTVTEGGVMDGFTFKRETLGSKTFTLNGKPSVYGDYKFIIRSGKNIVDGSERNDTLYRV